MKKYNSYKTSFGLTFKWFLGLLLFSSSANAQLEPSYTQYLFNTQSINPAYTGTWGTMGFMLLAREQWLGINNSPSAQTFSFQTLNKSESVGYGLNIMNDHFGKEKRFGIYGDYSYRLRLDDELNLRFGLKIGFSTYSNNLGSYQLENPNDPRFYGNIEQKFMPNFGVGAFMYKDQYYVGLSIPKIIKNEFQGEKYNLSTQAEIRNLYVMGGYVFDFNRNLKFKPSVLSKISSGVPIQFDINASFLLGERVWLGAIYRTGAAYGFMAQWLINRNLRFGYAVDFPTTELQGYQNGTHEIMVSYEIKIQKTKLLTTRLF